MMKTKSSIKRTRRGYTLRLTKAEYFMLYRLVDEANGHGDFENYLTTDGRHNPKRELAALGRVMDLFGMP
jgi:hypothetical protein